MQPFDKWNQTQEDVTRTQTPEMFSLKASLSAASTLNHHTAFLNLREEFRRSMCIQARWATSGTQTEKLLPTWKISLSCGQRTLWYIHSRWLVPSKMERYISHHRVLKPLPTKLCLSSTDPKRQLLIQSPPPQQALLMKAPISNDGWVVQPFSEEI